MGLGLIRKSSIRELSILMIGNANLLIFARFLNSRICLPREIKTSRISPDLQYSTGGGGVAGVKAACLESRSSRVRTPLWHPTLAFKFQRNKRFLPYSLVMSYYCGELRDREVACSASDRQGSNF